MATYFTPKCWICPKMTRPKAKWSSMFDGKVAESICRLLWLEIVPYKELFKGADYCDSCQELVLEIDFLMRTMREIKTKILEFRSLVSQAMLKNLDLSFNVGENDETDDEEDPVFQPQNLGSTCIPPNVSDEYMNTDIDSKPLELDIPLSDDDSMETETQPTDESNIKTESPEFEPESEQNRSLTKTLTKKPEQPPNVRIQFSKPELPVPVRIQTRSRTRVSQNPAFSYRESANSDAASLNEDPKFLVNMPDSDSNDDGDRTNSLEDSVGHANESLMNDFNANVVNPCKDNSVTAVAGDTTVSKVIDESAFEAANDLSNVRVRVPLSATKIHKGKFHCPELECQRIYSHERSLFSHFKVSHPHRVKPREYRRSSVPRKQTSTNRRCTEPGCTKICLSNTGLKSHLWQAHGKTESGQSTTIPVELTSEQSSRKEDGRFHCFHDYCTKSFPRVKQLKYHVYLYHTEQLDVGVVVPDWAGHRIKCREPGCSFFSRYEQTVQKHMKELHPNLKLDPRPIKCTHCDKAFKTQSDLTKHFNKTHRNKELEYNSVFQPKTRILNTASSSTSSNSIDNVDSAIDAVPLKLNVSGVEIESKLNCPTTTSPSNEPESASNVPVQSSSASLRRQTRSSTGVIQKSKVSYHELAGGTESDSDAVSLNGDSEFVAAISGSDSNDDEDEEANAIGVHRSSKTTIVENRDKVTRTSKVNPDDPAAEVNKGTVIEETNGSLYDNSPEHDLKRKQVPFSSMKAEDGRFRCSEPNCRRHYGHANSLYNHYRRSHPDKFIPQRNCRIFRCTRCSFASQSEQTLQTHMKTKHCSSGLKRGLKMNRKFPCDRDNCDQSYSDEGNLNKHIQIVHEKSAARNFTRTKIPVELSKEQCTPMEDGRLRCIHEYCQKTFTLVKQLKRHVYMWHTEHEPGVADWGGTRIRCEEPGCSFFCRYGITLKRHMKEVHPNAQIDPRPMKCPHCDKSFKVRSDLTNHYNGIHRKKEFVCHLCGKPYAMKSNLDYHMRRSHKKEKPLKCGICHQIFFVKEDLDAHEEKHVAGGPLSLTCLSTYCYKIFENQADLRQHVAEIHSGEKKVICEQCGKSCTTNWHLQIHQRIHTSVFAFPCTDCDKKFRSKAHQKSHYETVHAVDGGQVYPCKLCDKTFHCRIYLYKHNSWHIHGDNANKPLKCQKKRRVESAKD